MGKQPIRQRHHICHEPEITRIVRKGVHRIITLIRRFNSLTDQEVDTIKLEAELKRKYEEGG